MSLEEDLQNMVDALSCINKKKIACDEDVLDKLSALSNLQTPLYAAVVSTFQEKLDYLQNVLDDEVERYRKFEQIYHLTPKPALKACIKVGQILTFPFYFPKGMKRHYEEKIQKYAMITQKETELYRNFVEYSGLFDNVEGHEADQTKDNKPLSELETLYEKITSRAERLVEVKQKVYGMLFNS